MNLCWPGCVFKILINSLLDVIGPFHVLQSFSNFVIMLFKLPAFLITFFFDYLSTQLLFHPAALSLISSLDQLYLAHLDIT